MADFVYDGTELPLKSDLKKLGPGQDPTKHVQASDWNKLSQAAVDLRQAVTAGRHFGLAAQGAPPAPPPAGAVLLFCRVAGDVLELCALFPSGAIAVVAQE